MKHVLKDALSRLLARVLRDDKFNPWYGICNEVAFHGSNANANAGGSYHCQTRNACEIREAFNIIQKDVFQSWPLYSGKPSYPVSAPISVHSTFDGMTIAETRGVEHAEKYYYQHSDRWAGHGLAQRVCLLRHCIKFIDDMTRAEYELRYGYQIKWS